MRYPRAFRIAGWLITVAGIIYLILGAIGLPRGTGGSWSYLVIGLIGVVVGSSLVRWARRNLQP